MAAELEAMEKRLFRSWLLAFYGEILTENQREMARLHWEEDLTFAEIAQQFSVSRQSVHDTVARVEKQLEGLEESGNDSPLPGGGGRPGPLPGGVGPGARSGGHQPHLAAARQCIDQLLEQEER